MTATEDKLRRIFIQALRLPPEKSNFGDSNLVSALGIDSISTMEILLWVEDEFQVQIADADLSPDLVDSLSTLARYVERAAPIPPTES